MFRPPEHSRNLSLRLSQVFDEIGVNEDLVMRRRIAWMLIETIASIDTTIDDTYTPKFLFGSQPEGSTTLYVFDFLFFFRMFQTPEHSRNLSLRLSQVFDEIGVNEDLVMKRRRAWVLFETINNMNMKINDTNLSKFNFGSQTEGSTTLDLRSDIDCLFSINDIRVISDWSEWEHYRRQYLMVQDDTVSPGYCLLQAVRYKEPIPEQNVEDEHHSTDQSGRVLLGHSMCLGHILDEQLVRHGPAAARAAPPGGYDVDGVLALHCSTWPKEADAWLQQQNASGWPTEDMKLYSAEQGCFIVPVASKTGVYQDLEWRISTSLAERCIMWNLNISQLRCYILMKMILQTFLKPKCGEAISSFMCKNILFQCIADSRASIDWHEGSLMTRVIQCLQASLNCILTEYCPHFIISQNNLLAGKLSAGVKHQLTEVMCKLTENLEQSLLAIQIDDLGSRLTVKLGGISGVYLMPEYFIANTVAQRNIDAIAHILSRLIKPFLQKVCGNDDFDFQLLTLAVYRLCQENSVGSRLEQAASSLFLPFFCSHIGSIIASVDLHNSRVISLEALRWFFFGLNSDISSGRLKLASALYCAGDLGRCETLLSTLKWQLSQTAVLSRCFCYRHTFTGIVSEDFLNLCYEKNEDVIKQNIAFCVSYLPCEVNCLPSELKYEMFRCSEEDWPYRGERDYWMDWAVVDSLPYLHFLQYKVYRQLHRPADQQQALDNLIRTIDTEPNLGHRETDLNLLGQCMEQENRYEEALRCYILSMKVKGRNNVAKWHVCRMLSRIVNQMTV